MATIINNTNITLSSKAQQSISDAAANAGIDEVHVAKNATDGNNKLFDFYDEEGSYIFSIDLDGNVIWDNR